MFFLNNQRSNLLNIVVVVAGVWSLGGDVRVAVRRALLLACRSVGSPPPRTVWYHNHNIITHHPRFTRNKDDSLLIKSRYPHSCFLPNGVILIYVSGHVIMVYAIRQLQSGAVKRQNPRLWSIVMCYLCSLSRKYLTVRSKSLHYCGPQCS